MTDEELNILIAALERKAKFFRRTLNNGQNESEILLTRAATALTALRTERDELAATIEKARADVNLSGHAFGCPSEDDRWEPRKSCDCYVSILAASPASRRVVGELKAGVLEEAADDRYADEIQGSYTSAPDWLRARAASFRADQTETDKD